MNIYYVNRYSKYKGPFDIIDSNREHIIKVGDICLRDYVEGVAFLVVSCSDNTWNACKRVGIGNNDILSDEGNTLLFSFDGLHRRKGSLALLKQLINCYREKVIVDFFRNAIEILEYKKDFWDVSLFQRFFAASQELIARSEVKKSSVVQNYILYPSEFAKYLDKELLGMLMAGLNTGNGLKVMYKFLREKEPVLFRNALMKFLADNPTGTIYDKPSVVEKSAKPKEETVLEKQDPAQEEKQQKIVPVDEDQSYLLSEFNNKEFRKLLNRYHKGEKSALEQLVKGNMKLVTGLARAYKDHGVEFEDLVQEGSIGLMRAIERFNPNRKVQFPVYAKWWIHHAFAQALIDIQSTVKIPGNQVRLYKKVRKCIEQYEQEHEYEPPFSEIDIDEDVDPEILAFLSSLPDSLCKLTTRFDNWDEMPSTDSADDLVMKEARSHYISTILRKLKKREAYILKHLYGIGEKSETLSDIGERLGLTRERVRQISEKAVRKLRDRLVFRKVSIDEDDSSQEDKTDAEIKFIPKKIRREPVANLAPQLSYNPVAHQEEVKKDYSPKESDSQYKVSEKDNLRVGDSICYDNRYCTIRKIIENGKFSKLIVEYTNGVQDFVSYDKSRYVKIPSSRSAYTSSNEDRRGTLSFSSSTSLYDLVEQGKITKKELKHCQKRNLRTIGDVEQIIKQYHLTPDSTRFTQYTLDIWFSIVGLVYPNNTIKAKAEVPVREAKAEANKPIDTKKLEIIFDNKSTSYKYFWFMAIISLAREKHSLSMTFKDILIRMAALAWPIILKHKIILGKQDMFFKYLTEIANRTSLDSRSTGRYVEFYLGNHYEDAEINRTLSPLLNNVPYRFLSPWVKFTTNKDVSEKSKSRAFDGLYALYSDGIVLNSKWWHYINAHYREICNSSISSFNQFAEQNNSSELVKRIKYIDWNLLVQQ